MDNLQDDLSSSFADTLVFINQMLNHYQPIVLGASLLSLTLSLYKTVLPPSDFDDFLKKIYETKDSIKSFKPYENMLQ